jgi:hypothetical protein
VAAEMLDRGGRDLESVAEAILAQVAHELKLRKLQARKGRRR